MKIVSEERWEKVLQELTPDRYTLELISESNHDPYRRVYSDDKYCYKIVLKGEVTGILRVNTLEQEYSILKKCNDISGVPEALKYSKNNNAEVAGVGFIVDRSNGKVDFGSKQLSTVKLDVKSYLPEECPLCEKGIELVKPGSRKIKAD